MSTTLEAMQLTKVMLLKAVVDLETQIEGMEKQQIHFDWKSARTVCTLNGYRYLLGPEAPRELGWEAAKLWCRSAGGDLPLRHIMLLAYFYADIKDEFSPKPYWTGSEASDEAAWHQDFHSGRQDVSSKEVKARVRVIRRELDMGDL